jgi:hypothetical protein
MERARSRCEPWYSFIYLPNRGQLPSNPTSSKWALEMDFDAVAVVRAVRVPTLLVYAESDVWVRVDQRTRYMPAVRPNDVRRRSARLAGFIQQNSQRKGVAGSGYPVSMITSQRFVRAKNAQLE